MKTGEFARSLKAFAKLAKTTSASELEAFAEYLASGEDETLVQRLKKSGSVNGYPESLKTSLEIVQKVFSEAHANKQASSVEALLKKFRGKAELSVEEFIYALSAPPSKPTGSEQKKEIKPDYELARELANELTTTELNPSVFNSIIAKLENPKEVNTPTLHLVANQFLGNSKCYKGRKYAIEDIVKRQHEDAHDHALRRALNRVAV